MDAVKIAKVELGKIPRVVLGVVEDTPFLSEAAENGVDFFEVRVDYFSCLNDLKVVEREVRSIKKYQLPIIGTVRSHKEGGKATLSDTKRVAIYEAISPLVDAVDIELNSTPITRNKVFKFAKKNGNAVILSYHNFEYTPARNKLNAIVDSALSNEADVVKIATLAKNREDVIRLLQFTAEHRDKNLVTIAMGSLGAISRLAFPMAGSLMTYTSVAPSDGQIPLTELVDHLRFYYPAFNEELINKNKLLEFV